MSVASPDKGEALVGRGADTAGCEKKERRKRPIMYDRNSISQRLDRRPDEEVSRSLSRCLGRVKKLATETAAPTTTTSTQVTAALYGMEKLKMVKDVFTVGTWNARTLWITGKLKLLKNDTKRYRYDVIGISEVQWTGKSETSNGDFIWSGENNMHTRNVGMLLDMKARKALLG